MQGGDPDVSCHPCTEDGSTARILQLSPPPCDKTPGSWEAGREGTKRQGGKKSVQVLWDHRHSWKSVMEQSWIQHPGLSQELELSVPGAKGRAGPWSLSCSWCQVPQGLQHPARAPPDAPGAEPQGLLLQTNPQGTPTLPPSVPVPGEMLGFPQFKEVRTWLCHHLSPSQAPAFLGKMVLSRGRVGAGGQCQGCVRLCQQGLRCALVDTPRSWAGSIWGEHGTSCLCHLHGGTATQPGDSSQLRGPKGPDPSICRGNLPK